MGIGHPASARASRLHVQDNRIVKVTSPLDHDVSYGHLCVKDRFGFEFVQRRTRES
jgi:predicted molibdopterin-dependent oxidoreductase YjgC